MRYSQVYKNTNVYQQQSALPRPEKNRKSFRKFFFGQEKKKRITIQLNEGVFQYYYDQSMQGAMERGSYDILVGNSFKKYSIKKHGKALS
jgi:hypothetical protein